MFGFGLLDWIKLGAGAALGAAVAAGPVYIKGRSDGKAALQAEAAREAFDRFQELEKSNAEFRSLDDRGKCLQFMRDSGLPDSACD